MNATERVFRSLLKSLEGGFFQVEARGDGWQVRYLVKGEVHVGIGDTLYDAVNNIRHSLYRSRL